MIFNWILLDENSRHLQVTLSGKDYELWGNSYQYVIDYIYNGLGLTQSIIDPVIDPVIEPVVEPVIEPVVEPIGEPTVE